MKFLFSTVVSLFLICSAGKGNAWNVSDTLPQSGRDKVSGKWEVLFDGTDTDKWRSKDGDRFPTGGWLVKDSLLYLGKKGAGDIVTKETFSNFVLVLDFMLTRNANSGIKYFVGPLKNNSTGKTTINGPEYQIIDDYNHPAVKNHKEDIASTASCYLLYTPEHKILHPEGEWNHAKIVARGRDVTHWLNGIKVLSYKRGSKDFEDRKAKTKFKDWEGYGVLPAGHILLTDHGDTVYFKNIKIRRL